MALGECRGHRAPIFKLVLIACYSIFGFNSKPILYLNVLLFSALSFALLWAIRKVRGRWYHADAYLPIVLLNLGQTEAFSWAQTFAYVITTCLETLLLILIVTHRGALKRRSIVLAGTSLILLPLIFAGGVVFAGFMLPWLVYQGWLATRAVNPSRRKDSGIAFALAGIAVTIIGFYFIGYRPYRDAPLEQFVQPGLVVYAVTTLKYLAAAFGGGAHQPWWQVPALLVAVILLTTSICLILALARSRLTGNPRAVGLAAFMLSCLAVACVVGTGRYMWGNAILNSRYAALSVVVLIGSYFVWELYGARPLVPLGRMLLFTAAAGFLAANLQQAVREGVTHRDAERAFLRDLLAHQPIPRLVAHHSWVTFYDHVRLAGYLRQLRDAGIKPYDRLPLDTSFRTRTLHVDAASVREIDWDGAGGRILGPAASLKLDLEKPEFASGLRFRFSLVDPNDMLPAMRVRWYSETEAAIQQHSCRYGFTMGEESEIVVYIDDKISQLVILPNNRPSSFRISQIELLMPETGQIGPSGKSPLASD